MFSFKNLVKGLAAVAVAMTPFVSDVQTQETPQTAPEDSYTAVISQSNGTGGGGPTILIVDNVEACYTAAAESAALNGLLYTSMKCFNGAGEMVAKASVKQSMLPIGRGTEHQQ